MSGKTVVLLMIILMGVTGHEGTAKAGNCVGKMVQIAESLSEIVEHYIILRGQGKGLAV